MSASLITVGGTHLGHVGNVNLSELNSSDAETRVFTTYDYLRVNRFEISDGDAPTPAAQPGAGGNASLLDWDGYTQWDAARATGNNFDCTGKDWDHLNFSWARPTNYTNFPQAEVRQQLLCLECSPDSIVGCEGDDWTTGTSYAFTDGTTAGTGNGLNYLSYYICGVRMQWDDDGDAGWERTSNGYDPDATLSNGAIDDVDALIIRTNNTTTTTPACDANGEPCNLCPTDTDCCSTWCDGLDCVASDPVFC